MGFAKEVVDLSELARPGEALEVKPVVYRDIPSDKLGVLTAAAFGNISKGSGLLCSHPAFCRE